MPQKKPHTRKPEVSSPRKRSAQISQIRLQAEAIAHLAEGVVIASGGTGWTKSKILFVNDAVCRITGYSRNELIGRQRSMLNGKLTDRKVLDRVCRELSEGKSAVGELIQYRKDGIPYYSNLSITPLPAADGRFTTFVSIHRDTTEQKKNEQALRESEERFRYMADHAPVMIWICGIDKRCTWVSKPWLDFTGRTMDQELGNGWAEGIHKDDFKRCWETYSGAFDSREPFTMEYQIRRHDQQWRWVLDSGIPFYHDDHTFAGYIGSCIDITDRKNSENAVREHDGLLQAILHTAADSVVTIDRRGTIVSANPATERIFGYTREELIGKNIKMLMPEPYCDEHDSYIARYITTQKAHIIGSTREVPGRRKDGSIFPTELNVSEIAHLGLFTGIHRDISLRKRAEEELDQYRKDLKAMASELLLAEDRERKMLAEDLHDGLGQAVFRARLRLDQLSKTEPAVNEVITILEEIGRMTNSMIFNLSPPSLRRLGLRAALRSLMTDMRRRYGLVVELHDDGKEIPLSERVAMLLFRSIRELLINVVKHAETTQVNVTLRRRNHTLHIDIEDHGKGFDPLTKSARVESGRFGLFSIRERLDYIGGTFKIRSTPGAGAKASLTAPLEIGTATHA